MTRGALYFASTGTRAALVSWGIAVFEYLFQVPANRIGYTQLSLSQLEDHASGRHLIGLRPVRSPLSENLS